MALLAHRPLTLLITALLSATGAWVGSVIGARYELAQQTQKLRVDTALRRELLRSEIERHRLLPTTLARNPQLAFAADPNNAKRQRDDVIRSVNEELEQLARIDGAATLYLIDAKGLTLAASNHRLPTTFVGQDYSFRTYFRDAMATGAGELFAQGTVSGIPGLYLAQKLRGAAGVIVTKVEFTRLEENWRIDREETLVTDRQGLVLLTSVPARRFNDYVNIDATDAGWIADQLPAQYQDWTLILRRDVTASVFASRLAGAAIGGLLGLLLCMAAIFVRAAGRRREDQRLELEHLIAIRTAELDSTNRQLLREIDERLRSEATVTKLRENLTQANRLAILGQISAGVAHEVNQPTAAIRTYVDNARILFERGDSSAAFKTLDSIVPLTERIGLITDELRQFSRRSPMAKERVVLREVIDGSRLLLDQSLRLSRIRLERPNAPELQQAHANRTRLEQVVVNLLQNAIDALANTPDAVVTIATGEAGGMVWIQVADNGPGVPQERRGELFAPFSTSKPLGLGLGLVISRDIASDLGGSLEFHPAANGGAMFLVKVPAWPM